MIGFAGEIDKLRNMYCCFGFNALFFLMQLRAGKSFQEGRGEIEILNRI